MLLRGSFTESDAFKNERLSVLIQNWYIFSLNDENIFIHGSIVRYRKHQWSIEDIWDSITDWQNKCSCFTIVRLFLPDLFIQVVIKNVKRFIQNGILTSDWSVFFTLLLLRKVCKEVKNVLQNNFFYLFSWYHFFHPMHTIVHAFTMLFER